MLTLSSDPVLSRVIRRLYVDNSGVLLARWFAVSVALWRGALPLAVAEDLTTSRCDPTRNAIGM